MKLTSNPWKPSGLVITLLSKSSPQTFFPPMKPRQFSRFCLSGPLFPSNICYSNWTMKSKFRKLDAFSVSKSITKSTTKNSLQQCSRLLTTKECLTQRVPKSMLFSKVWTLERNLLFTPLWNRCWHLPFTLHDFWPEDLPPWTHGPILWICFWMTKLLTPILDWLYSKISWVFFYKNRSFLNLVRYYLSIDTFFIQVKKPTQEKVHSIITKIVELEIEFLSTIFTDPIEGIDGDALRDFARFKGDQICALYGFKKVRRFCGLLWRH